MSSNKTVGSSSKSGHEDHHLESSYKVNINKSRGSYSYTTSGTNFGRVMQKKMLQAETDDETSEISRMLNYTTEE
ncbi:unnamed protein product, partial [Amoebophrya sp. A120]|eukprot:GSA120T00022576001.1